MRHFFGVWLACGIILAAGACSSDRSASPVPVAPATALETLVLTPTKVAASRAWDGRIEAIANATLAAQTGGRVAELPVDVGDRVEEGAVVVRFTQVEQQSGQRQAQAGLTAARAAADEAAATLHRVEDVYARRLVSAADYDRAKAAHNAAQAQLGSARAALRSADEQVGYTAIRAPYRGVVTARFVQPGETVAPGQPLLSGLSLDRLRLVVDVPQSLAAQLRADTPASILTDDGRRIAATRLVITPQADVGSHAVSVRLDLPEGEPDLLPGMSAKALFDIGTEEVLAVPATAVATRGEVVSVFVLRDDGLIAMRQVRLGRTLGGDVEVLAGLSARETIAVDAAAALQARRTQRAAVTER